MTAKVIIITGASDGIGAAAARMLHRQGHTVVVVGRSPSKTKAVAAELGCRYYLTDFAVFEQVRDLGARLKADYPVIDVLVNNAGGIMGRLEKTVDGNEKTLQVNHLSPFLLTDVLMDTLIASNATIINTSSQANSLFGHVDLNNLQSEGDYVTQKAYGASKLMNILFTKELDRRFAKDGVSTAAFHPGVVRTAFSSESGGGFLGILYSSILKYFLLSPEKGAATLVWLATTTPGVDWQSGGYYVKCKPAKPNVQADDRQLATGLWDASVSLTSL